MPHKTFLISNDFALKGSVLNLQSSECRSIPTAGPQDADALRKMVLDLTTQLDRAVAEQHKYQSLVRRAAESTAC